MVSRLSVCLLALLVPLTCAQYYFPPLTRESGWTRNMILSYIDSRSFTQEGMKWNEEKYTYMVGYRPNQGPAIDQMFDSVLLIGIQWKNGKNFWPGQGKTPTNKTDWIEFGQLLMDMGVTNLGKAVDRVGNELKWKPAGAMRTTVNVMIPYPEVTQKAFGEIDGRMLDFSKQEDRIRACTWYIDYILSIWPLDREHSATQLIGFYWFLEELDLVHDDVTLLAEIGKYLHAKNLIWTWIPYQGARGIEKWRDCGFDYVTYQPNFAFRNATKDIFRVTAEKAQQLGYGIEMELPRDIRNPNVKNWQESFDAYCSAGVQYGWQAQAIHSYYHGMEFYAMATSTDPNVKAYYDRLYWFIKGTYPHAPIPKPQLQSP